MSAHKAKQIWKGSPKLRPHVVPIDSVRPWPENPRNGDIEALRESLRIHGQYQWCIATSDRMLIVGNHRYMAMMEEQWTGIAIDFTEFDSSDERAIQIAYADNHTSDLAANKYDNAIRVKHLTALPSLVGTTYRPAEIDRLVRQAQRDTDEDLKAGKMVTCPECGHSFAARA